MFSVKVHSLPTDIVLTRNFYIIRFQNAFWNVLVYSVLLRRSFFWSPLIDCPKVFFLPGEIFLGLEVKKLLTSFYCSEVLKYSHVKGAFGLKQMLIGWSQVWDIRVKVNDQCHQVLWYIFSIVLWKVCYKEDVTTQICVYDWTSCKSCTSD